LRGKKERTNVGGKDFCKNGKKASLAGKGTVFISKDAQVKEGAALSYGRKPEAFPNRHRKRRSTF